VKIAPYIFVACKTGWKYGTSGKSGSMEDRERKIHITESNILWRCELASLYLGNIQDGLSYREYNLIMEGWGIFF